MTPCVVCEKKRDEKRDDLFGYLCMKCSARILRWLRELEEYLPTLHLLKPATGIREYSTPVFGSRSPANDAVLVHTDPRSDVSDRKGFLTCGHQADDDGDEHAKCNPPEVGALSVVASWSQVVVEERNVAPESNAYLSISLLRRNHSWIIDQPWVDEYAEDLRRVHSAVRILANDPIPRSVGKCIRFNNNVECKGDVFELDDASGVKCSKCGDIYTGLDLERFRVAQEA